MLNEFFAALVESGARSTTFEALLEKLMQAGRACGSKQARRCKKWRIVRLGFGTARQIMVLERWTNPKPLQPIRDRAAI
jgi:hypothetical protein